MTKPDHYILMPDGTYIGSYKGKAIIKIQPVGRQEDKHGTR